MANELIALLDGFPFLRSLPLLFLNGGDLFWSAASFGYDNHDENHAQEDPQKILYYKRPQSMQTIPQFAFHRRSFLNSYAKPWSGKRRTFILQII
jgi:hypothetical protein